MILRVETKDPLQVLQSTKYVLDHARHVFLDQKKLSRVTKIVKRQLKKGLDSAEMGFGVTGNYEDDIQLILIENAVNFCFWTEKDKPKWSVEWPKGNLVTGGWYALKTCFERAMANEVPILDASFLAQVSLADCERIFEGSGEAKIPLVKRRKEILNETGKVLLERYAGSFTSVLIASDGDAIKLVKLISQNFPSFRDIATFENKKIYFLKRAQILANDLSYLNYKQTKLKRIDELTAFADYKIPQMLRAFGVVEYSKELAKKVDGYELIPKDSREEIEIRSATIWGVELIRRENPKFTAPQIDNALWLVSQELSKKQKPYHRTYTHYY